jgi:hypothetical protein
MGNIFTSIKQNEYNDKQLNTDLMSRRNQRICLTVFCSEHSIENYTLFNNYLKKWIGECRCNILNKNIMYIIINGMFNEYIIFYAVFNEKNAKLLSQFSGSIACIDKESKHIVNACHSLLPNYDGLVSIVNVDLFTSPVTFFIDAIYFNNFIINNLQLEKIGTPYDKNRFFINYDRNMMQFIELLFYFLGLKLEYLKNLDNMEFIFHKDVAFIRSLCKNYKPSIDIQSSKLFKQIDKAILMKSVCF